MLAMEATVAAEGDLRRAQRARGRHGQGGAPGRRAVAGLPPQDVFRTNVVKHFRFSGTRGKQRIHKSPSRVHVAACGPWLVAELAVVKPSGVVVLGGTAGKAVYGSAFRVGETRGRLIDWPETFAVSHIGPTWVLTTTHPSAVLRADDRDAAYEALVSDLRVAVSALSR